MSLTPNNKIKLSRIKDIPALVDNTDKFIISENNEIKYVTKNNFQSILNSSNIVNEFKILSTENSSITFSSGSVISPVVNGKQYILKFDGGTLDTNININEGGTADKIATKMWKQPILTSNNSSNCIVTTSDINNATYDGWKAFDGTNTGEADCWLSSNASSYHWLQIKIPYEIEAKQFFIQNRNNASAPSYALIFDILASNDGENWDTLVSVDNVNTFIKNSNSNGIHDYEAKETNKQYSYFRYVCHLPVRADNYSGVGRLEIIGNYKGYRLPDTYYNIFVIGKENEENPEAKIITTTQEYPEMPEGYTYGVKLGFYKTDENYNTIYCYPKMDLNESFNHGFVVAEQLDTNGYRIYSDGWKVQWGVNANPVFPVAFDNIPVSVERGATNVTRTGMTIGARYWNVEGY